MIEKIFFIPDGVYYTINLESIYNPIKNSEEHDAEGLFIKQWIPELKDIPSKLIHEPHKLTLIEQQLYACEIGKHYPAPIVDLEATRKKASEIVWSFRKNEDVKIEAKKILAKHVNLTKPKLTKTKK